MPIYEFYCHHCERKFERLLPVGRRPTCPAGCDDSELEKIPSLAAVHFTGSGFYETDYKKKS